MKSKSFLAILFAIGLLMSVSLNGQSTQNKDVEKQLIALSEESRQAALKGDASWLETHTTDDFTSLDPAGKLTSKIEMVQLRKSGAIKYESIEVLHRDARVYGETAIVIGRSKVKAHFTSGDFAGESWLTQVWVKQNGAWKLAASQSTGVRAAN
jgi:ketosteroid isomerase-like protein